MARCTINTRDKGPLHFWVNGDSPMGGYVYMHAGAKTATGKQICYGGGFRGNTVTATAYNLLEVARLWNRQRRAWARTFD